VTRWPRPFRPTWRFTESRPLGGAFVLDGLWRKLGIDAAMRRMLTGTRMDMRVERILFALVANRALAPSSKLAATRWIEHDVVIDGVDHVVDEACYRAMDWLITVEPELSRIVYDNTANLLNLEVDLLSSTPPPPTSRSRTPTRRSPVTSAKCRPPTQKTTLATVSRR
jgi:hypothetical protein